MKMRNLLVCVLLGIFFLSSLAFAQEDVTITFWHRFSERHNETLLTLKEGFEALHPNVTVEFIYQGSYGALQQKINASVVAGNTPTMTIFYENWIPPIAEVLLPISDYLTDEEKADIIEGLKSSSMYEGKLVTVPFNKSIMVFYYIEEFVPVPPTTWEEYYNMAKDLTVDTDGDGGIDRYGTGFRPAANPEQFLVLLAQNEGSILNADWTEATINNELGVEALEYYASLAPYSLITSEYLNNNINALCMAIDTSAGHYYWNKAAESAGLTVKVAKVPGNKNAKSAIQGTNIGIFPGNATQAEIDAAVLFVKYLLEADNTAYWAAKSGYMPVTYAGYETAIWGEYLAERPYAVVMSDQMLEGFSQILHPNYGDMRDILSVMCEEVMLGESTPLEAANAAAEEIETLLEY